MTIQLNFVGGLMWPLQVILGKTTLSDRLLEATGAVSDREKQDQMLDSMDLERERGITIKSHAVTLDYRARNGRNYTLNLIDTPGHVDFSYEVSRSLAACEGALLVVDASQGVEAQTLANANLAVEHDLELIPVLNKIDLPGADVDRVRAQIEHIVGIDASSAIAASAKENIGIDEILESIVELVPAPGGDPEKTRWFIGLIRKKRGKRKRAWPVISGHWSEKHELTTDH